MSEPSTADLKALAEMRLADARALAGLGRHSACYYLAGYAVECGLKAILSRAFRAGVIPSRAFVLKIYTHDLNELAALAGLKGALDEASKASPDFQARWAFASGWSEASRYEIIDPFTADRMLDAVGGEPDGIMQWLKARW